MRNDIIDLLIVDEKLTELHDIITDRQWTIALFQSEGLTRKDICIIMGLPLWKVKYEIHKMRRTLKNVVRHRKRVDHNAILDAY